MIVIEEVRNVTKMTFINILPVISNPITKFNDLVEQQQIRIKLYAKKKTLALYKHVYSWFGCWSNWKSVYMYFIHVWVRAFLI